MARFCGRTARVQGRVTKSLDEKTGAMLTMKSPCIVLEGVTCRSSYRRTGHAKTLRSGARSGGADLKDIDLAPGDLSSAPKLGGNELRRHGLR